VRGTLLVSFLKVKHSRFIPARAGNIGVDVDFPEDNTVHPRACGEHFGCGDVPAVMYGSSPRVRGTSRPVLLCLFVQRFIPARAGNIQAVCHV